MISIIPESFSPELIAADFARSADGAGGIVTFTGIVRPESKFGTVTALHLQSYSPMTESGIEGAVLDAEKRWPLIASRVVHRIGDVLVGEPIVFVATASAHRRDAFEAADFLMDYLKTKAIFWKKEITSDSATWIEPRVQDYSDAKRWNSQET